MKKRAYVLLALCLAALSGATVVAQTAPAPTTKTISIATLAPPGSTWMRVFDAWNRDVRRRSNNTLQFKFYAGGVQGDEAEVIRKIRSGRLDGAAVTAVGLSQVYRPALVFQLPGLLRTYAQLDTVRTSLNTEMDTGFAGAGFKLLGWGDVGQSRLFSKSPVKTPGDLANKKPWVWRDDLILPAFFQVVRSNPVPLQIPEVLGALQTNRIDTVLTAPTPCVALQWCSKMTHMMDMPLAIVIGGTVISKRTWDSLTEEQRVIMNETSAQFHTLARRNLRRDETQALTNLTSHGMISVPVSDAEKAQWNQKATETRGRLAGQIGDASLIARVTQLAR